MKKFYIILAIAFFTAISRLECVVQNKDESVSDIQKLKTTPEQLHCLEAVNPIFITIHAPWCRYCTLFSPHFYQASQTFKNRAHFYTLELKEFHPEDPVYAFLQTEYNATLKVVPTIFVIQDKKVLEIIEGCMNHDQFVDRIKTYIPAQEKRSAKKRILKSKNLK